MVESFKFWGEGAMMASGQAPGIVRHGDAFNRVPEDSVREELQRLLASPEFRASKRCQSFLKYVVESALGGHADALKERTIAIDVFGRPASYDPSEDSTVRVKAGEIRKRLSLYYAGEGSKDTIRIELPPGTYVPEFREVPSDGAATPGDPATSGREGNRRVRRHVARIALAILAVVLATGFVTWQTRRSGDAIVRAFWGPVFAGGGPVSLCASFVPVYGLTLEAESAQPRRPEDFVLLNNQFVGGGDLVAVAEIGSMLTRMRQLYRLRIGDMTFDDLRSGPAILVGYSYTRWKEISRQMRFFIDATRWPRAITDNGRVTDWALPNLPADRRTNEDYAIISRVFHPDTRAMLVEIAGITQYGTQAAADLATNPDLLADAMRGAPAGWQKKNLQLVIHTKVISGAPVSPRVVATYFW